MSVVFIGGSRRVSRLPVAAKRRLDNVMAGGHDIVVGDANGADRAVQAHLHDSGYDKVTVFCSGGRHRNNLGNWNLENVAVPRTINGFQFYAAKDREMARQADYGFMIWDGKSAGTLLNVLRLVNAGKIAVLFRVAEDRAINVKTPADFRDLLAECGPDLYGDLRKRATPEEWQAIETLQPSVS